MGAEQQVTVLLLDAAVLMVVGMGVVYGFLMLLVWAVQAMSWVLRTTTETVATPAVAPHAVISPAVVAAISSAIEHHQKQTKELK